MHTLPSPVVFDLAATASATGAALRLASTAVMGAMELLSNGNTIPFIARYRKERTGGIDEVQIGAIADALTAAKDLVDRKNRALKLIAEQGTLDRALERAIRDASHTQQVDDLYRPFKTTRQTRAATARQRGLEPLADILAAQATRTASRAAVLAPFLDPARDVADENAALAGASDILAERWSAAPSTRAWLRGQLGRGFIRTRKKRGYAGDDHRFEQFYDHREPIGQLASHRLLAMKRGEAENALSLALEADDDGITAALDRQWLTNRHFVFRRDLEATVRDCYTRLLKPSISSEVLASLREIAEQDAIVVFATNLGELLLAPPASGKVILGIDPGFRTGCKVAVIDGTGKFVGHTTVYPTAPTNDIAGAERELTRLIDGYAVEFIAIGNGTASRETVDFCRQLERSRPGVTTVVVNESGASIYSASAVAREEFPALDLTVRGAISIARRLQDPLAELVKIDPKSIGVGQYQHDVNQVQLKHALDRVVGSSVNRVGVDVNTASASLLSHVAGIGPKLAHAIVAHRDANGRFSTRHALLTVPRFGARAFEQSAGFLRVRDGSEPLDASAVHPESYYVVQQIASRLGCRPAALLGNSDTLRTVTAESLVDDRIGLPTARDILSELAAPGRDPRREFEPMRFADGVTSIDDVERGMRLEGVVTNVTHFGAFVDIGVHQDGLIHVSELDTRFVKDPTTVVKVGDRVQVEVLDIDPRRRRIGLSRKRALASRAPAGP
ncbi:MAG: Tex family protein [Vicinamibacterales bacterium]|nr:Tex family protein [Vicinamibacterales bacterium]